MIRGIARLPGRWLLMFAGLILMGFPLLFAQGSAGDQALRHLRQNRSDLGLTGSDVGDVVISSTVVSKHNGVTHVYLQQRYRPHGIGYVWNTMLWEVYWNLVDRYGYNANVYDGWNTGGNNLALQLVMDGMKFQPCSPGFVDGRNAILAADRALTAGVNQCEIWRGFAKRGLGVSANQGLSTSRTDGVQAFDLPASCTAATFDGFHPPIEAAPSLNIVNAGAIVPVKFTLAGGGPVPLIDSQPVDCTTLVPTGTAPVSPAGPGSTDLTQNGDGYHVNWKTDAAWAASCRRLTVRIPAASHAIAYFKFQ